MTFNLTREKVHVSRRAAVAVANAVLVACIINADNSYFLCLPGH